MEKLDKFHYHEVTDRSHMILSLIDDYLLDHPAMDDTMKLHANLAIEHIMKIYQKAAIMGDDLK